MILFPLSCFGTICLEVDQKPPPAPLGGRWVNEGGQCGFQELAICAPDQGEAGAWSSVQTSARSHRLGIR